MSDERTLVVDTGLLAGLRLKRQAEAAAHGHLMAPLPPFQALDLADFAAQLERARLLSDPTGSVSPDCFRICRPEDGISSEQLQALLDREAVYSRAAAPDGSTS